MSSFTVKNNAESLVVDDPLAQAAVTLNVTNGEGANFPSTFPFLITIWDETTYPDPTDDSSAEIVKCTARSTDALTIVRGQEGTGDVAHALGERVAMLITAGILNDATYGLATKLDTIEASADVTDAVNIASTIHGVLGKSPPVNNDEIGLIDSATGNVLKKITWDNVKSALKTYFDTLYNNYTHPNHTGPVTSTGDGATAITDDAVTYGKIQNVVDDERILGRVSGANGVVEELSPALVLSMIGVESGADVTDAVNVASTIHGVAGKAGPGDADELALIDSAAGNALKNLTWANVKVQLKTYFDTLYNNYVHPNHTGAVTSTGDGATAITDDAVTYAKIQNISATDKILGRSTAGAGIVEEIACTVAGRAILDDVDAAAQRTTLGSAASGSNSDITELSGLSTDLSIAQGGTGQSTASAAFDALKQAATSSATGVVELAITSEINTGTDAARSNTPDALAGSIFGTKQVVVKVIADDTALTVADGLTHFTVPAELNGMNLISVGAHVYTVSSSGLPAFQIHNLTDAADMLSTAITIDANENDSKDAATPPVINAATDDVATGNVIRFDCDVAGTGTKGMEIRMGFRLP